MQAGKRCVRCKEMNDPDRVYCIRCGKYLTARAAGQPGRQTVWEQGLQADPSREPDRRDTGADQNAGASGKGAPATKYVIVCPECGTKTPVRDGIVPLACGPCGYFFQAGLDPVVPETDAGPVPDRKRTADGKDTCPAAPSVPAAGRNPMPRAARVPSSLRLILTSHPEVLPETVGAHGGVLGAGGTILRQVRTGQQLDIHQSSGIWYARVLKGEPCYNGDTKNAGCQFRLEDGGMLIMDQEQIRVELT